MSETMDNLAKLRKVVEKAAEEMDLKMGPFSVMPAVPGTPIPDTLTVTFIVTPEAVETMDETEQRRIDAEFEAMINGGSLAKDKNLNPLDDKTQGKVDGLNDDLRKWMEGKGE